MLRRQPLRFVQASHHRSLGSMCCCFSRWERQSTSSQSHPGSPAILSPTCASHPPTSMSRISICASVNVAYGGAYFQNRAPAINLQHPSTLQCRFGSGSGSPPAAAFWKPSCIAWSTGHGGTAQRRERAPDDSNEVNTGSGRLAVEPDTVPPRFRHAFRRRAAGFGWRRKFFGNFR